MEKKRNTVKTTNQLTIDLINSSIILLLKQIIARQESLLNDTGLSRHKIDIMKMEVKGFEEQLEVYKEWKEYNKK